MELLGPAVRAAEPNERVSLPPCSARRRTASRPEQRLGGLDHGEPTFLGRLPHAQPVLFPSSFGELGYGPLVHSLSGVETVSHPLSLPSQFGRNAVETSLDERFEHVR